MDLPPKWFFSVCIFIVVNGHSVVKTPKPWKTGESRRSPCGNGKMPTTNQNTGIEEGQIVNAQWDVNAGDGNGPVTVKVAFDDQLDFSADGPTLTFVTVPKSGTGNYPFTFTIPAGYATTCKGGPNGDSCHFSFRSTSNWYSCITLPIVTPAAPTAAPTTTKCENFPVAESAAVCKGLAGKSVVVGGVSIQDIISQSQKDQSFNQNLAVVYRNGFSTECRAAVDEFFCAKSFQECTKDILVCTQRCEIAVSHCDLDPSHDSAFGCSSLPTIASDIYGTCPTSNDIPSRKINLQNRYVDWKPITAPDFFTPIRVWKGDLLHFTYDPAVSSLWQFNSQNAYDNCLFGSSSGSMIGNDTSAQEVNGFAWSPPDVSVVTNYYFGSKTASCKTDPAGSQKIMVTVLPYPAGSTQVALTIPPVIDPPEPPCVEDCGSAAALIVPFCWWFLFHFSIIA